MQYIFIYDKKITRVDFSSNIWSEMGSVAIICQKLEATMMQKRSHIILNAIKNWLCRSRWIRAGNFICIYKAGKICVYSIIDDVSGVWMVYLHIHQNRAQPGGVTVLQTKKICFVFSKLSEEIQIPNMLDH